MKQTFKTGQQVEAAIESVAFGGYGVARVRDMVLFVPGTVEGDIAEVRITEVRKNYLRGKVEKLAVPSSRRVNPACPYYPRCGGCQYQHIAYDHQLELKKKQVVECFRRIGQFPAPPVADVHPSPEAFHYRGKAELHLRARRGDRPEIGFMDRTGSRVVDVERCEIMDETINQALFALRRDLTAGRIHSGAEETRVLWSGEGTDREITRVVKGREFRVPREGFFQANLLLTDALVDAVLEMSALGGGETVLDAYCGSGLFSVFLADRARQVFAVEIDREAVQAARLNFQRYGHDGAVVLEGAVEDILRGSLAGKTGQVDVAVLDPPRTGCDAAALAALAEGTPKRIIYVSCDPATQARDIRYLADRGFSLRGLAPFDMFPQTKHIEVVALLTYGPSGEPCGEESKN